MDCQEEKKSKKNVEDKKEIKGLSNNENYTKKSVLESKIKKRKGVHKGVKMLRGKKGDEKRKIPAERR